MKLVLGIVFTFLSVFAIGQTDSDFENKLNEIYAPGRVDRIVNDAQMNAYFKKVVYHSYKLEQVDAQKLSNGNFPVLASIEKREPSTKTLVEITPDAMAQEILDGSFNILLLNLDRDLNESVTYRLGNTNYLFTLYSHKAIAKK